MQNGGFNMSKLNGLKPLNVFKYFEEICGIPHGSENMDAISEYCVKFAEDHSLKCIRDDANNVIVFKPATKGYENAEPVFIDTERETWNYFCEKEKLSCQTDTPVSQDNQS